MYLTPNKNLNRDPVGAVRKGVGHNAVSAT